MRRFQNITSVPQGFYLGGYRSYPTTVKAGAVITARNDHQARLLAGFVKHGILVELSPSPDPEPAAHLQHEGPCRFKNISGTRQGFNPPWLARNWNDGVIIEPNGIVSGEGAQADFWRQFCTTGQLVEVYDEEDEG